MIRIALVLFLIGTGPAVAQDLVYSNAASRDCVLAATTEGARLDCIGASANACMTDTPGGQTTVGMSSCLDRELTYWDNRLNRIYQRLRKQERTAGVEAELQQMQRAWIAYRDAACTHEAATWGGGTGSGPAYLGCLIELTARQTLRLERYLWEGDREWMTR